MKSANDLIDQTLSYKISWINSIEAARTYSTTETITSSEKLPMNTKKGFFKSMNVYK